MNRSTARKRNRVQDVLQAAGEKSKTSKTKYFLGRKKVADNNNNNDVGDAKSATLTTGDDVSNNNNADRNANAKDKNGKDEAQGATSYSQYTTYTEYLESLHKEHEDSQDVIEDDWELVYCLMRIIVIVFPITLAIILLPIYYSCGNKISDYDKDVRTTIGLLQPFLSITTSILIATFTQPKQAINVPVDMTQKRGGRGSQESARTGYDNERGSRDDEATADYEDDGDPTKPQEQDFRTLARALARAKALYRTNKENEVNDMKNMRDNLNMNASDSQHDDRIVGEHDVGDDADAVRKTRSAESDPIVGASALPLVSASVFASASASAVVRKKESKTDTDEEDFLEGKSDTNIRSPSSWRDADGKPFVFNQYNNDNKKHDVDDDEDNLNHYATNNYNNNNSNDGVSGSDNNNNDNNNNDDENDENPTCRRDASPPSAIVEIPEVAIVGKSASSSRMAPPIDDANATNNAKVAAGGASGVVSRKMVEKDSVVSNVSLNAWPWNSSKKNASIDEDRSRGSGGILKRRGSNKVDPGGGAAGELTAQSGAEAEAGEGEATPSGVSPYRCPAIVLIVFFSTWIIVMFVLLGVFHFGKGC